MKFGSDMICFAFRHHSRMQSFIIFFFDYECYPDKSHKCLNAGRGFSTLYSLFSFQSQFWTRRPSRWRPNTRLPIDVWTGEGSPCGGRGARGVTSEQVWTGSGVPMDVTSDWRMISWVVVTWESPVNKLTNTHDWKHLATHSYVGGNKRSKQASKRNPKVFKIVYHPEM